MLVPNHCAGVGEIACEEVVKNQTNQQSKQNQTSDVKAKLVSGGQQTCSLPWHGRKQAGC